MKNKAKKRRSPKNFSFYLKYFLILLAIYLIIFYLFNYLVKSGIFNQIYNHIVIINSTNSILNCQDQQCVTRNIDLYQENDISKNNYILNPKHWCDEFGIYWSTKQPCIVSNYIEPDAHYYYLNMGMSLMSIARIYLPNKDLYEYAKENATGSLERIDINGNTAYAEKPRSGNPFSGKKLHFYEDTHADGVSYNVFSRDSHDNIYRMTIFIDNWYPGTAQIYAGMVKSLEFSKLSTASIENALKYDDPVLHFTSSFENQSFCIGQDVPVQFEAYRIPPYHAPVSMELSLEQTNDNSSGTTNIIEKKFPLSISGDQEMINTTYHWITSKTADNTKIKPGSNYYLDLVVKYDNQEFSLKLTDKFTIEDCSK